MATSNDYVVPEAVRKILAVNLAVDNGSLTTSENNIPVVVVGLSYLEEGANTDNVDTVLVVLANEDATVLRDQLTEVLANAN